jgi:hypothetical protein
MSLVGFWNSAVSATVTFLFPWELSRFGAAGTFLGYGLFALLAVVFVLMFIPETKGKSLEELEDALAPELSPARSPAIYAEPTTSTTRTEPGFCAPDRPGGR